MSNYNNIFRVLRSILGLSAVEMAGRCDISAVYLRELEHQKKGNPSDTTIQKIASAAGIRVPTVEFYMEHPQNFQEILLRALDDYAQSALHPKTEAEPETKNIVKKERTVMEKDYTFRRGCLCWFSDPHSREEDSFVLRGRRPVIIASHDTFNEMSATVIVVPMSTNTMKKLYRGQFDIIHGGIQSRVHCDQIRVVDKASLEAPYATLDDACMDALDRALMGILDMEAYLPEPEAEEEQMASVARLVTTY